MRWTSIRFATTFLGIAPNNTSFVEIMSSCLISGFGLMKSALLP